MAIKEKDFIKVDFTAKIKDSGEVFDTTREKIAKAQKLDRKNNTFEPQIICIGANQWLPALDAYIIGKDIGKYKIELSPERAFGKKSAKLLQLIPRTVFLKQEINPVPGLEVNIDDRFGIIRSVTGGRVMVDFNHPLASRDIVYELEILEIIKDDKIKASALLSRMGVPKESISANEKTITIKAAHVKQLEPLKNVFEEQLKKFTSFESVKIIEKKEEKKEKKS